MNCKKVLAYVFGLLALCSFTYAGFLIKQQNSAITLDVDSSNKVKLDNKFLPTQIKIDSAEIHIPIVNSTIKDNTWEYVENGASYLDLSPIPGDVGNSIIYGHNWNNLLGNLKKVQNGDLIEITYNDNTTKTFKIYSKFVVTPDQTHILSQTDESKLTIYTCTGFLDSKRLVVTAKLI